MTADQWQEMRFFTPTEFDSPDAPGSGRGMDYEFMKKLDTVRANCGFPFPINSGFRSPLHNASVPGSVDGSAHTKGLAADIALTGREPGIITLRRWILVKEALDAGFIRIGIGETFVHLDMDLSLPSPRMWTYGKA